MAITFRGTATAVIPIIGNDALTQNVFAISNAASSRVNVNVRRLTSQNDPLLALATVRPVLRVSKAITAISGGHTLPKNPFDTSQSSSAAVTVLVGTFKELTATAGNTIYQQYAARNHTIVEQMLARDTDLIPDVAESGTRYLTIRPGESLLVQVVGPTAATNPSLSNNVIVQCVLEEDTLGTFAISGTVTLGGSPLVGAKVVVVESSDRSMTNPALVEVLTTNASGQWASSIVSGRVGAAFVQYQSGGTYYTAPGSPFLEQ